MTDNDIFDDKIGTEIASAQIFAGSVLVLLFAIVMFILGFVLGWVLL